MNQSTERLVVFVTPAQKRVLAARAASLGISLSELVRRAVLAFDDTGEEVRAAGLVDRLSAARSRASDSDTLRRLAAGQTAEASGGTAAAHAKRPAPKAGARHPSPDGTASGRAGAETQTALPVAAAVAQALAARATAADHADVHSDADDEARVARIVANKAPPTTPEV